MKNNEIIETYRVVSYTHSTFILKYHGYTFKVYISSMAMNTGIYIFNKYKTDFIKIGSIENLEKTDESNSEANFINYSNNILEAAKKYIQAIF